MLTDYMMFGQVYRWQPSEIDNLTWAQRKEMRQAYEDAQNEAQRK